MTNRAKAKGTAGETAIVRYLIERGWIHAKRITLKGNADEGDVVLGDGIPVMIESKMTKAFTPSVFVDEMNEEVANALAEFGCVVWKRRGTTNVGEWYCLTTVDQQMRLIERVWRRPPKKKILQRRTQ